MKSTFLSILLLFTSFLFSQEYNLIEQELSINKHIDGTLLTPETEKPPLAILLSGSGPNDRDGNSNMVKGNMLKKLAEELYVNGVATYRYDKRSFKQIKERNFDESMTFDAFIEDASASIAYFKSKNSFSKIYVIGHSQGSLVGIIAAKDNADGFISLAGAGVSIDEIITDQVQKSAPMFTEDTKRVFAVLKSGKTTDNFPQALMSIFNKPTQPFMMSWMKYNPQEEIKKLGIPILIINGNKDIQVSENDANLLHEAVPESKLKIIDKMNHALVLVEGDRLENVKSYNEIKRALSTELIQTLVAFLKQ